MTKNNSQSALVESVLTLDEHFHELTRLGSRIENMELKTTTDFEQAQHLINRFAERAQEVSNGVIALSGALNEARAQAESATQMVAARAMQLQEMQKERQQKMENYRLLGQKVQALTLSLNDLKRTDGSQPSAEDRARISMRLAELELELEPLIAEAQKLKGEAQIAKMGILEESAHSLSQSLQALSKKLSGLREASPLQ